MVLQRIGIKVDADTLSASRNLKSLNNAIGDTRNAVKRADTASGQFIRMQKNIGSLVNTYTALAAGIATAGAAAWASMQAYGESQRVQLNLERAITNANGSYERFDARVQKVIASQSQLAAVDDELVATSLATLTRATGDVTEAMKLNQIALDVSRATGKDLAQTALVIGKVYNGNVGALKRYGITVAEGATATEALAELQGRYAGYAEDYGKSQAGAADRIATSWGNLQESFGEFLVETGNLDEKLRGVSDTLDTFNTDGAVAGVKRYAQEFVKNTTGIQLYKDASKSSQTQTEKFTGSVEAATTSMQRYRAAVDEARTATAASEDAELASLYASQRVTEAKQRLKEAVKEHGKKSREARIAQLELNQAEREAKVAAEKAAEAVGDLASANSRLTKNEAIKKYLDDLRNRLSSVGDKAGYAGRRIAALSVTNGGRNSGGVLEFAEGGVVSRPTLGLVGEAGTEVIVPVTNPVRGPEMLNEAARLMGASSNQTVINITGSRRDAEELRVMIRQELAALV